MTEESGRHPIVIDAAGGEYMESVVITAWGATPGAAVKAGDTIVTVETAKAATEIPAARDGYLAEIRYAVGSEAPVGSVLGYLSDDPPALSAIESKSVAVAVAAPSAARAPARPSARIVASPYARRLAEERGLDLRQAKGSGPSGRIKSRDLPPASTAAAPRATQHPIILLHGFGADSSIWRWLIPLLRVPNKVIALDLPGHGASRAAPGETIADMALSLAAELAARGITDAHVVGHSLGGAVALALTAAGPLRIHSLGLLAPAGLGKEIDGDFLDGLVSAKSQQDLQPWLDRMVGNPQALPSNLAGAMLWQRAQVQRDEEQMALARKYFPNGAQRESFAANLAAFHAPAKLIWGKSDRIIPVAQAHGAPGTTALHLLDGIGHVPQLECADVVARLVDELVRSTAH